MNRFVSPTILLSLFLITTASSFANDNQVSASRNAVKMLGGELKKELLTSIKEGGHINAIPVCSQKAPQIAERVSKENNLKISRKSLRYRNPLNAPDLWEEQTLLIFEERKQKGEDINSMEHSEQINRGKEKVFRYMKAIPVGEPCLACHGDQVNDDIKAKLEELYPEDRTTGFAVGDIIGAFSVTQE